MLNKLILSAFIIALLVCGVLYNLEKADLTKECLSKDYYYYKNYQCCNYSLNVENHNTTLKSNCVTATVKDTT